MPKKKPNLLIPPHVLAGVQDHARGAYPREACGFLIGVRTDMCFQVHEAWPASNTVELELQPSAYAMDPRDWISVEKRSAQHGQEIIGIYHSHPNHSPAISQTDIAALWPNLVYLIVSTGSQSHQPPEAWILDESIGTAISCRLTSE